MLHIEKTKQAIVVLVLLGTMLLCGGALALETNELVPSGQVGIPNLNTQAVKFMPPTFSVRVQSLDPDSPDGRAASYRYMVKPAVTSGGITIITRHTFDLYAGEILSLQDENWSPWLDIPAAAEDPVFELADLADGEYFLISVQVMDSDGTVSDPFGYQRGTAHVRIIANFFRPLVTLSEIFLGTAPVSEFQSEIAGGQPVNFSWTASAAAYNGEIISYRHGWDLVSVDDPNDPGWAVAPGLSAQNLFAQERVFQDGIHTFTLRVEDSANQVRVVNWVLRVVPFVSREYQKELMVIDQVVDANVQNWPDQYGMPRNSEDYRNPWWHFLAEGLGGVAGINWERDWWNHSDTVSYSDVVAYKVVLCYAQVNLTAQRLFQQFRPVNDVDQYVWLTPYAQRGGNVFLVGGGSTDSFFEGKPNYMVPMVFDTIEETLVVDGTEYEVGFGTREMPDGTEVLRGPLMYPYATAGIAALDWTSPNTKTIYGRNQIARFDRQVDCVGLKGLVLDEDFKTGHLIGPGVLADTMFTESEIDWHDYVDAAADTMRLFHNTFPFRDDEFVDMNISARSTVITPQECVSSPTGMCVEPMFRGIARFDYLRNYYRDRGEDWPASRYSSFDLADGCGSMALTQYEGEPNASARTNDKTFGYLSYKAIEDKPVQRADVYWGFDPYRFDHENSRRAIRWVLQYMGLQINQ